MINCFQLLLSKTNLRHYAEATPQVLALLTSGLTASIALEQVGGLQLPSADGGGGGGSGGGGGGGGDKGKRKKVVLVTAAAGGTGQIAVQLAKLAGHTVVATCGGDAKVGQCRFKPVFASTE